MASRSSIPLLFLLLLTTTAAAAGLNTTAIPFQELESMLQILRNRGYTLFTNAIATSDLKYQLLTADNATKPSAVEILSSQPFTLFAPVDELLFALDMSSEADAYVSTLRYHVVPNRRHTYDDLRNLSSPFLETLLPHYSVLIGKIRGGGGHANATATVGVMVDGVRLSNPDLFLGSRISVHGIDGILLTSLNMNHQFDRNHNGSGHFAPAGSASSAAKGTPRPRTSTAAPATHFGGNRKAPPSGASQEKAEKISAGMKKQGMCRRGGRVCHRRNHRGRRRHPLEDL